MPWVSGIEPHVRSTSSQAFIPLYYDTFEGESQHARFNPREFYFDGRQVIPSHRSSDEAFREPLQTISE